VFLFLMGIPAALSLMPPPTGSRWLSRVMRGAQDRPVADVGDSLAHLNSLYGLALKLTRNRAAAEDLVQDTYLKAVRFWPKFRAGTNLKAWLSTILHNTFRNDRRGASRRPEEADSELVDAMPLEAPGDDPEQRLLRSAVSADVQTALDGLPDAYREAVWLRDVEDFSYQEIADILGVPVGTVMSRIARGRKALYTRLVEVRQAADRPDAGSPGSESQVEAGASSRSMSS
jgi:RNA polymerase sigma-70 factor (ECF subfamily)